MVSLAGQQVAVKSEAHLQPGQVFTAQIHIKGSQVQLALVHSNQTQSPELFQKFSTQNLTGNLSPSLSNLLSSLGLPADSHGARLLQFAQQLGIKLDPPSLYQSRKTAGNFSGREEEAFQTALAMDAKGLASTYYAVDAVFSGMEGKGQKKKEDDSKEKKSSSRARTSGECEVTARDIKDFFSSMDSLSENREAGALTVFNQVTSSRSEKDLKGSWFLFPFEWDFQSYRGLIRVFCSLKEKRLHQIVITFKNDFQNWCFVLYFTANTVHSVRFSAEGAESTFSQTLKDYLLHAGLSPEVSVEQVPANELSGFCPADSDIQLAWGQL